MTRLKTIPMAVGAVVLSAGTVLGFAALPEAATPGLAKATSASGHHVPARDDAPPVVAPVAPDEDAATEDQTSEDPPTEDGPPAGTHGADVSAVATAPDTTPDTNHGADVSAVARTNHGQTVASTHRPAGAGKPADQGNPPGVDHP